MNLIVEELLEHANSIRFPEVFANMFSLSRLNAGGFFFLSVHPLREKIGWECGGNKVSEDSD